MRLRCQLGVTFELGQLKGLVAPPERMGAPLNLPAIEGVERGRVVPEIVVARLLVLALEARPRRITCRFFPIRILCLGPTLARRLNLSRGAILLPAGSASTPQIGRSDAYRNA